MSVCFELSQESENALAIKIREQVLKKLSECKTEEEIKKTLVNILSENDDKIDFEKIQDGNETISRLDNFLACSLQGSKDELTQTQIQLSDILKNAVDIICNPPQIVIPYPYPIFDLSDDFLKKLLIALLRIAIRILFSILKKILSLLLEICNSGLAVSNQFGSVNMANLIKNSIGEEVGNSFIGDVFNAFGINSDGTTIPEAIQADGTICNDQQDNIQSLRNVQQLLDDLSFMLTPVEICSLLNGRATDSVFQIVEELLIFEYPTVRSRINTRSKIENLFITLGSRNDPAICNLIEQNAETILTNPELCFTSDAEALRRNILENKNIPEEEIRNQLQKERERNKLNLQKVAELAAITRSSPNNIFGEPPNVFCKNNSPGLFNIDDMPSFKESLSETFDDIFDPFFTTYSRNSISYTDCVVTSEEKPINNPKIIKKFITITITTEDGETEVIENSINSKFMQKVSTGHYIVSDQFGNTDQNSVKNAYENTKINDVEVYNDSVLDVQTLINASFNSLEDAPNDNIYILNTETNQNVMPNIIENIYSDIDNYLDTDLTQMSISLKIPIKYKPLMANAGVDLTSISSNDKLVLKLNTR
jgi:hypothetical protein